MKEETINFTDGVKWFDKNKALNSKIDGFVYYSELKKNLSGTGTDNYISKALDTILWERLYGFNKLYTYVISGTEFSENYKNVVVDRLKYMNLYDEKIMAYTDLRVKKIKTLAYYDVLKKSNTTFKNKAGIYLLYQGLLDKIEWKLSEKEPMKADILRDIDQIMAISLQAENNVRLQEDIDFKVLERGIRIQLQNYLMHADLLDFQDMNLPKDKEYIRRVSIAQKILGETSSTEENNYLQNKLNMNRLSLALNKYRYGQSKNLNKQK